jgi:hypothetical protein
MRHAPRNHAPTRRRASRHSYAPTRQRANAPRAKAPSASTLPYQRASAAAPRATAPRANAQTRHQPPRRAPLRQAPRATAPPRKCAIRRRQAPTRQRANATRKRAIAPSRQAPPPPRQAPPRHRANAPRASAPLRHCATAPTPPRATRHHAILSLRHCLPVCLNQTRPTTARRRAAVPPRSHSAQRWYIAPEVPPRRGGTIGAEQKAPACAVPCVGHSAFFDRALTGRRGKCYTKNGLNRSKIDHVTRNRGGTCREECADVGQRRLVGPAGGARWIPRVRRPSADLGSGASSAQRWGSMVPPTRFGGPRKRRFVGPAVGPHGSAHALGGPRERPSRQRRFVGADGGKRAFGELQILRLFAPAQAYTGGGAPFGAPSPRALLILY